MMKNNKLTTTTLRVLTASCLLALANVSHAEIALGGNNGWEFSSDGSINGFLVNESSDSVPDNTVGGNISGEDSTRVRTGLLPAVLGFNIRSPMIDGIRGNARIGLYPQIQNAGTKNQFGSQIDLREAFFKVEGNFGEVLVGRALNLFQGKNLLTDMTLFGVGVQGGVNGGGTTLGRIGYGYIYANFNAQMRYTTPNMNGLQFSGSIVDPSQIKGDVAATETDMPAFEGELSYASTIGTNKIQGWVNGLWQEASFATGGDVSARGLALGGQLVMDNGLEFLVSGYTGQALGSTLMLDTDSLDSAGEERDNDGFIAQAAYTMGSTKFGLSYGESNADETDADRASGKRHISKQSSTTAGVYHDMNKWLKLVGEYTRAENEWYGDGSNQKADVISVGAFFLW